MNDYFKYKILWVLFSFTLCSCGDSNVVSEDTDSLITLKPSQSISLLSISADKGLTTGSYTAQNLATLIRGKNPDVIAMQDVDYRTSDVSGKDLVSEISYLSSKDGQPRQGTFTPILKVNGGERGLGLFVRDCFLKTERIVLDDVLVMHTMKYTLKTGSEIIIATCQFDRNNETIMQKQSDALSAYADSVKSNVVIAASIHKGINSDVLKTIEKKFRRSCKYQSDNTYPASNPVNRYDYILTPLSQNWRTQIVEIIGDATTSDHKGIFIRIGIK